MLDLNKNFADEVYEQNGHVVDYTLGEQLSCDIVFVFL